MSGSIIGSASTGSPAPYSIHVDVPPRFYMVPGAAVFVGTALGLVRGSRAMGLRFLAENAHRPPTTIQGWYFYNKTKNYKMMLAGLTEAGRDASKLGFTALGWVTFEEGLKRVGLDDVSEIGAGVGTAALFAGMYRLPLKSAYRTGVLGLVIGCTMRGIRWGRERLDEEREARGIAA
ncbi:hypothetical protein BV25DRAFT_1791704 [Artomyces pyxidatus]|uniref:Uncharacterized protein n=1 Tax=Artomyces pyxidatus TaxID=48021 RepID=A0ACB8TK34_9AGAM|nr:hypothetical protein BV25DRAFT_1791704 [Artomyces pyxidatus]